jgi:hypothetical protein
MLALLEVDLTPAHLKGLSLHNFQREKHGAVLAKAATALILL